MANPKLSDAEDDDTVASSIKLPRSVLARLDALAAADGRSRGALIRDAVKKYLRGRGA